MSAPARASSSRSPLPERTIRATAPSSPPLRQQYLTSQVWQDTLPRISHAPDWQLLLQLDVSDYLQDRLAEGTVSFLVRRSDLAARAFDKTVAVYQQT